MMDEYISRKAVQNISTNKLKVSIRATIAGDDEAASRALAEAIEEILDLPPADVKPVVRGEWMDEAPEHDKTISERHRFRCPACGKDADYFIGGYGDWWCRAAPNFCPNCGADMRKEANDER